jgi:hypothetical protein
LIDISGSAIVSNSKSVSLHLAPGNEKDLTFRAELIHSEAQALNLTIWLTVYQVELVLPLFKLFLAVF